MTNVTSSKQKYQTTQPTNNFIYNCQILHACKQNVTDECMLAYTAVICSCSLP